MTGVDFDVEPDAPPFVLGVAANLKRAAAHPKLAKRLAKMKGVLALRSSVDPQTATVRFDRGRVALTKGASAEAGMTITIDPNDSSVKPKVSGAVRHLAFALNVAKVMEPPTGTWQEEAAAFWNFAAGAPRMPDVLVVVCTDDDTQVVFGAAGGSTYEILGTAEALTSFFSGASIFGQDILDGKLLCVGSFEHASVITGRSIAWVMGEGR